MSTYKVFIIEDDETIREAIRFVLTEAGHEVFEAPDGVVGLDLLRLATEPAVVVLDLMMPRMSGLELLHTFRRDADLARRGHAFFILSAAHTFVTPALTQYLHSGFGAVMHKPFDVEALLAQVEEAGRHLGTELAVPPPRPVPLITPCLHHPR